MLLKTSLVFSIELKRIYRMRVGILGYFGFGNFGDELFHLVWNDVFNDLELITFESVTGIKKCMNSAPEDRELFSQSVNNILIGGGDLIRPTGKNNYWHKELLAKNVYLYGIGVATWLGHDKSRVGEIINFLNHQNVKCIGVRDIESKAWLEERDINLSKKIILTPDIVFSYGKSKKEYFTKPTVGIVTRHQKQYQADRINQLKKIITIYQSKGFDVVEILASTGEELIWDKEGSREWGLGIPVVTSATDDEMTSIIASCSLVYSMKFHGCVVGLLNHVPSISLLKTDKFRNLYKQLRIENWLVGRELDKITYVDSNIRRDQLWKNIDTLSGYSDTGLNYIRSMVNPHSGASPR